MSVVRIETEISFDKLLKSVEQLNLTDLEQLMDKVVALKAKRKAPCIPNYESRLMLKINQDLPPDARKRFNELVARRQDEELTDDEHQELLRLTDLIEKSDAKRMEYISDLANIRGVSVDILMQELGILPVYA